MKINKIKCPLLACVQLAKKQGLWQYHRLHWPSDMVETKEIFLFCYFFFKTCQVLDFHLQNKESKGQTSYVHALALWRYFLVIQDRVNYIHPSTHLHVSVWGLSALPWNGNTGHVSDQMAASRRWANSRVCWYVMGTWACDWPPGSWSPDPCYRRQPCPWKVIC